MFREPNCLSTDPNPKIFICSGILIIYPLILILDYFIWSGNLIIYPLILILEYSYVQEPNYLSTGPNPTIFICSGNLIGLQLPDDNGEVLYLDPNDPAAQILLQEAGITMGRFPHTDHLMINYFMEKILFKSNFNLFENQKSNSLN